MTEILFGNRHYRIGSAIPCLAVDDFGGANGGDNVGVVVSPLSRQQETFGNGGLGQELEQRIIADLEENLGVPEGSSAPRCTRVRADRVPS